MIDKVKGLIPKNIKLFIRNKRKAISEFKLRKEVNEISKSQIKIVKRLREKEKINVIFLAIFNSIWKYEEVYKLLEKDDAFNVKVIVIPHIIEGIVQIENYYNTLNFFTNNGYKTIASYDSGNKQWLDIKTITNPDIVFFTLPYDYTFEKYKIDNFLDKLTCYTPYNFGNSHLFQMMHNKKFHNILSCFFAETDIHKGFSMKYALNNGINVTTTGYPGIDIFLKENYVPKDNWKIKNKSVKRIIWAPHHTIDERKSVLSYSSFIVIHEHILKVLEKNQDRIQIAFKPHPLLKNTLYKDQNWGKERTDDYYEKWNTISNGQLELGSYADLFLTSDAMIHDSGSFLIEYLYTSKPVLHTNRDKDIVKRLNSFGVKAFNVHYHAKNTSDIDEFIENVVLNGNDVMKKDRLHFFKSHLLPPNNVLASQNIYQYLKTQLNK